MKERERERGREIISERGERLRERGEEKKRNEKRRGEKREGGERCGRVQDHLTSTPSSP